MSIRKDLEWAVRSLLKKPELQDASCSDVSLWVRSKLGERGYVDGENGKKALYLPMYGHIWVGAGEYILDLWRLIQLGQPPILRVRSAEVQEDNDYRWPGKHRGILPTEVYSLYTYEELEEFYYRGIEPKRGGGLGKDVRYAYHATERKLLRRIAREGLLPEKQPVCHADEDRCTKEAVVFFCPTSKLASLWNDVILRFPWPVEWEDDAYSDGMIVDGEVVHSNLFTHDRIPPDEIDVQVGRRWVPLVKL